MRRMKTINKYVSKLEKTNAKWSKGEIGGLTKLLNSAKFERDENVKYAIYDLQHFANNLDFEHALTKEQTQLGIQWLKTNYVKKTGEAKSLLLKSVNRPESLRRYGLTEDYATQVVLHVIDGFSKFRFVGVYIERNEYGNEWHYAIYRTYAKDGSYFDYIPLHWSAPIIIDCYSTKIIEDTRPVAHVLSLVRNEVA